MRRFAFVVATVCLVAPGCKRVQRVAAPEPAERSAMRATSQRDTSPARALKRCFVEDASGDPARPLDGLLDRAAERYDHGDFTTSLTCAEEAARVEPRSVEAHHDRAAALQELGRLDDAEAAFTRALALDPDDPETLAGAADLYINRLPPTNDHTETGLEYARRGSRRLKRAHAPRGAHPDRALIARLALLEGQALNDLGRSREALMRLDAALAALPDDLHARYERAVALFDLCRFADAKRAFVDVLARNPHDAWAHHHLGLTLERLGDVAAADREMGRARQEAPAEFHTPVEVSASEFRSLVDAEARRLPSQLRADLGRVMLETSDLPDLSDLTAEEPPLAPTILGLFRGAPIGEAPESEARAIVIYRKNLARAVASRDELIQQIRTTLLHELGHLRGEDDDALRARGLE
ncbi:MAG: Tetratricopeptide 2 repeat protein [Myxococcales bacterium]|nr:Tetratricopeptide 2 repeat protein [Myxococcales bacterium]